MENLKTASLRETRLLYALKDDAKLVVYHTAPHKAFPEGNRLGISIGLHAGLVWGYYIVNVGQLIEYSNQVPVWVTGIDGNPIAGVMGLLFLSGLTGIILSPKRRSL